MKLKEFIRKGYKCVQLELNNKKKLCKVHRIVACTFMDICGEFNEVVNHLDENKLNNCASNLEWTTNKKNLSWGNIEERKREGITTTSKLKKYIRSVYDFYYDIVYNGKIKFHKYKKNYVVNDKVNEMRIHIPMDIVDRILSCEDIDELACISYIEPDNAHYIIHIRERKKKKGKTE